jgi:hypothetical protein
LFDAVAAAVVVVVTFVVAEGVIAVVLVAGSFVVVVVVVDKSVVEAFDFDRLLVIVDIVAADKASGDILHHHDTLKKKWVCVEMIESFDVVVVNLLLAAV